MSDGEATATQAAPDECTSLRRDSKPFLKWAGGKRWLSPSIEPFLPAEFNRYFEPFLGGAAMFFHLAPHRATLSDINAELVNVYQQIRDNCEAVIDGLRPLRTNKRTYLRMRGHVPSEEIARAVRFIYLNKTAFNGLYRVNRKGLFNVPFAGDQGRPTCNERELLLAAKQLKGTEIRVQDFEEAFAKASTGDFIYCDPPYTVRHNNNGFIRYNEALFSWKDQRRLADAARRAVDRGVHVIVSNAGHNSLRRLYEGFAARSVYRRSCMSGRSEFRAQTFEYVFIGRPKR